jgi:steroid delta-isomerase
METTVSSDTVSRAVRAFFLAMRAMSADAWVNCFAEDGITYDPVGSAPIQGHPALREFFESICQNFKHVELNEEHIFVAGSGAAVKWNGKGTSRNGSHVKFEGINVFEVNANGKIQTVWSYWNPQEMIAQL